MIAALYLEAGLNPGLDPWPGRGRDPGYARGLCPAPLPSRSSHWGQNLDLGQNQGQGIAGGSHTVILHRGADQSKEYSIFVYAFTFSICK